MTDAPPRPKTWLNGTLFVLTVLTACFAGLFWSASFLSFESGAASGVNSVADAGRALGDSRLFPLSALYAAALMIILTGHELGHYLTCRRYGVQATLPFFIPGPPLPGTFGTFGAFIKIKSRITLKSHLFDIGANGPFAGFVLALPALAVGLAFSRISSYVPAGDVVTFGEPLLFKLLSALFFGRIPEGAALVLHPVGWAGWAGLLVTSLNLLPISQLDGGHIAYAVLGRRAHLVSRVMVGFLALMGFFFWPGWLIFGAMILFFDFKFKLRLRHPPVLDEEAPLDLKRRLLSILIILIFILSFIPDPVKGFSLLSLFKGLTGG